MDESCIQVEHVSKRFGKRTVLRDVTVQVQAREIFGLLGPSGAGKTTLVKMIVGTDEASEGRIRVFGQEMPRLDVMAKIGYMAQSDALYMDLTALENLKFFAALYGLRGARSKQRIEEVIALVNLTDALNQRVATYSGGMKRRLSLAIALLNQPELLILDEPTVGIDPVLRASVWARLKQLAAAGTTVVVTTHVMDEAEKCNRLGMMRDGQLIATGTPEMLKAETGSHSIEEAFLVYGGARG